MIRISNNNNMAVAPMPMRALPKVREPSGSVLLSRRRRGVGSRSSEGPRLPRPPGALLESDELERMGVGELRDAAVKAATLGSEVILEQLDKPVEIETKMNSADLVTQTDKR